MSELTPAGRARVRAAIAAVLEDVPAEEDQAGAVTAIVVPLITGELASAAASSSLGRVEAAGVLAVLAAVQRMHLPAAGVCGTCVETETVRNRGGRRVVQAPAPWPCATRRAVDGLLGELAAVYGPAAVPPPAALQD